MTTASGPVRVSRHDLWHPTDGGLFPADEVLGVDGFLTRQARRLVTLGGWNTRSPEGSNCSPSCVAGKWTTG